MLTRTWSHLLVFLAILAGAAGWLPLPDVRQPRAARTPDGIPPTETPAKPTPSWTSSNIAPTSGSLDRVPSWPTDTPAPARESSPAIPVIATLPPCGEAIQNGDFQQRHVHWQEQSGGGYPIITDQWSDPPQGSWVAWFGGYNNANERLTQQFHVPNNAQDGQTLTFYLYVETEERYGTWDFFVLRFLDAAGNRIPKDVPVADNTLAPLTWTLQMINLTGFSKYRGQDVYIQFEGTTDSSQITNFVICEVSIVFTCGQEAVVSPVFPTPSPY